jgi:hypothetical protein
MPWSFLVSIGERREPASALSLYAVTGQQRIHFMKIYLTEALESSRFFTGDSPFRGYLDAGDDASRVALVTGPNASGKSFLVKLMASWLHHEEEQVEPIQVSMRYRTEGGVARAFMFGSDADQSTGATSLQAIQGALRTSRGRDKPHWVLLDEPDIGLSEDYAAALGEYLTQYANDLPKLCLGFMLITHSRKLAESFLHCSQVRPHFVHLEERLSRDAWLANRKNRSVAELLSLDKTGTERWRKVEDLIKNKPKVAAT